MIDVVDAMVALVEPTPGVARDGKAAAPYSYQPNTVYGWVDAHSQAIVGTGEEGGWGEIEERFSVRIVFVADNAGEEAAHERDRSVSEALDKKADEYLKALTRNQAGVPWDTLTAVVADHDFVRQLELRGISILASGYRLRRG